MKRLFIFPMLLLLLSGCMTRLTQRLDDMNEQLIQMNAKLDESNRQLASVEKSTGRLAKVVP
jgi:hypothetical protein